MRFPFAVPLLTALALAASPLRAQPGVTPLDAGAGPAAAAPAQSGVEVRPLFTVGGALEEAARTDQLRGAAPAEGFLLRSPSSLSAGEGRTGLFLVAPEVQLGWNSDIPFGLNDGALWSGRGGSTLVRAGIGVEAGPLRLIVAPELAYASNASFEGVIPDAWREMDPQAYLPPWQVGEHSIDLPYRMGDGAFGEVRPGQSSLTLTAGPLAVGASTENEWWGPGVRNALLLSNQAAGFGHLFLRTARPLSTPIGQVEARWISGALHDSEWFASQRGMERGWRSLSGAALVVSPARTLSLGIARTVHTPADGVEEALSRGTRVFTRWSEETDPASDDRFEQITALWGRLVMPGEGAEVYAEWARTRLPLNVRDLMEVPEHSQGYTLGLQWLRPAGPGEVRLQAEHTYIEESPTFTRLSNGSWYASAFMPQGYTHEGQVLGASVGPGGSGQWLAVDWLRGRGRGGAFLGRIRWAEDAYYDKPGGPNLYLGHDVSMYGGLRGVLAVGPLRLDAEYTLQKRWNYLFQSTAVNFNNREATTNVVNHTLRLGVSTIAPRLGPR